ncbi:MAG: histidine kinase [Rhodocyclaceae bacterium]|nr:histidine kinase [Rhodocyclaceae bacterium]
MDLRKTLVTRVGLCALALLLVSAAAILHATRHDVAEELKASSRLVSLMLALDDREAGPGAIEALVAQGGLRHVSVVRADALAEPAAETSGWQRYLLGDASSHSDAIAQHRVTVAGQTYVIQADPSSELGEALSNAALAFLSLAVFCLAALVAVWLSAERALKPVRILERALEGIGRGRDCGRLGGFELREFASIGRAIERLSAELQQVRASERLLARRLIDLQENERRELARELHDELGQSLTAVATNAAVIERRAGQDSETVVACAHDIRAEATHMLDSVRGLLRQLRPHGLTALGLEAALQDLVDGWRARGEPPRIDLQLTPPLPALEDAVSLCLYRTLQETLTNVIRHARAGRVQVALGISGQLLRLSVSDDGVGRAGDIGARMGGGLLGMRERVHLCRGELALHDVPGGGLRVIAEWPLCDVRAAEPGMAPHGAGAVSAVLAPQA